MAQLSPAPWQAVLACKQLLWLQVMPKVCNLIELIDLFMGM
jgi:hypothetical protein